MDECIGQRYKDTQTSKADLIRTLGALRSIAERRGLKSANDELSDLSEKLMVSRFHLAIVGQMKRGKSSVVNALLGAEVLPTGILPLTSVITLVRYSPSAGARIIYQSGHAENIEAQHLDEYITEAKNPGNRREVASAEVYWPSPLLQLGIDLVDTPGIGSTHSHNTTTTERYLREMDAAVMVLSVDPPITAAESEFLRSLRCEVPRLLFVLNKTDTVTAREVEDLLRFVKAEICNKCGVAGVEVFPVSAREAIEKIRSKTIEKPGGGIAEIAKRLEYFAAEEKEQALLESVAQDVLRVAGTLRFAASLGDKARRMNDGELGAKKKELENALVNAEKELLDLRHLLHKDTGMVVQRIEEDLKNHVEESAPGVRERLAKLQTDHPKEAREDLGLLLDHFVRDQIRRVYEDWRVQEDERIRCGLSGLSDRFTVRSNRILEVLQETAGALFEIPASPIRVRASLAVESRLYYYTEPTFKFLQEKLIFLLPGRLQRRMVFRRMKDEVGTELERNAGRIHYDYLERVEKAVEVFEKQMNEPVRMMIDSIQMAMASDGIAREGASGERTQIEDAVALCVSILAEDSRS